MPPFLTVSDSRAFLSFISGIFGILPLWTDKMFKSPPKITSNICELNFKRAEKLVAEKMRKQIVTE